MKAHERLLGAHEMVIWEVWLGIDKGGCRRLLGRHDMGIKGVDVNRGEEYRSWLGSTSIQQSSNS